MKKTLLVIFGVIIAFGAIIFVVVMRRSSTSMIQVISPQAHASISSPLVVMGEARGTWYFEADFPVKLYDGEGNLLAQAPARAQGNWMTENFVPFATTLAFDAPQTKEGVLVLEKDNPSGDSAQAAQVRIPVTFATTNTATKNVKLYYYEPSLDMDASGNLQCSRAGLAAVMRHIPMTNTPIQDTVNLLLKGGLTDAERARGITTEFPLAGFKLTGASRAGNALTLSFADPQHKTNGGSCGVNILWYQIEATAKQFPGVASVRFQPDTLFQP